MPQKPGANRHLVSGFQSYWMEQIDAARVAKKNFQEIGDICYNFYQKASGFMWEPKFKGKYLPDVDVPKFSVTIQKAFEFVAVIGPYLLWNNPNRKCSPSLIDDYPPELFASMVQDDPMGMNLVQQMMNQQGLSNLEREWRSKLMERYLNYSSNEQPNGLFQHCQWSVHDAMIRGRGVLWPKVFEFPGDTRKLTMLEWGSVNNLFIDPDCTDPQLRTAKWIARRHLDPYWVVEQKFGMKKDTLKGTGTIESNTHKISDKRKRGRRRRETNGETGDIIEWFEIYSRMGVGTRDSGFPSALHFGFEEVVGDWAYLCISPSVDHPLNLPASMLRKKADDVFEAMLWPCPSYVDGRFPVAFLDFYPDMESCWPIPPLGPAIGELIAMNIILSAFLENAYDSRKTLVAIAADAVDDFEKALKSTKSTEYVRFNPQIVKNVNEVVQVLRRPDMSMDPLKALEWLSDSVARRTGLTDFQFAVTTTQSRSAADISAKEEKSSIRPDKMSRDVAAFITEASRLEAFLAALEVTGDSLEQLLGPMGAVLWDRLISSGDPVQVAREMDIRVEASDIRRPNRARDSQNVQNAAGIFLPMYQTYASLTGDSEPLKEFIDTYHEATEMPKPKSAMGPWAPNPQLDPEQQQMQQQMAQVQLEGEVADTEKTKAETAKIMAEIQGGQQQAGADMQLKQLEFQFDQQRKNAEFETTQARKDEEFVRGEDRKEAEFVGEQERKANEHQLKLTAEQADAMLKQRKELANLGMKMAQFRQESKFRSLRKGAGL